MESKVRSDGKLKFSRVKLEKKKKGGRFLGKLTWIDFEYFSMEFFTEI